MSDEPERNIAFWQEHAKSLASKLAKAYIDNGDMKIELAEKDRRIEELQNAILGAIHAVQKADEIQSAIKLALTETELANQSTHDAVMALRRIVSKS